MTGPREMIERVEEIRNRRYAVSDESADDLRYLVDAYDAARLESLEQAAHHADCCVDREELAELQAALRELWVQMSHPDVPEAFGETMRGLIDVALLQSGGGGQ